MSEKLTHKEHCERLLQNGYALAAIPALSEPDPYSSYQFYPVQHGNNIAAQWRGMAAIRLDLSWNDGDNIRKWFEERFDGDHVPKVTIPGKHETWLFTYTEPFRALRSGGIRDKDGVPAQLALIAKDAPWCGILVPPSRMYLDRGGLQSAQWRNANVMKPAPVPEELAEMFKVSTLVYT